MYECMYIHTHMTHVWWNTPPTSVAENTTASWRTYIYMLRIYTYIRIYTPPTSVAENTTANVYIYIYTYIYMQHNAYRHRNRLPTSYAEYSSPCWCSFVVWRRCVGC